MTEPTDEYPHDDYPWRTVLRPDLIHEDEHSRILLGDALSVLTTLEDASVDALITDPPYSSGGMVRGDRMSKTAAKYVQTQSASKGLDDFTGDNRDQRAYAYWCALWLGEALRVVKPGGVALLFTDWRQLPSTVDAFQSGGWVWRGIVPWVKPAARPMSGRFTNQAEYVVWGSNGPMPVDYDAPVLPGFYEAMPPREREHITQKPLDVMRGLVRIVPPGGTILDLFAGSGTTAVAALLEGRNVVASELLPTFADLTRRRILQAQFRDATPNAGQAAFDFAGLEWDDEIPEGVTA